MTDRQTSFINDSLCLYISLCFYVFMHVCVCVVYVCVDVCMCVCMYAILQNKLTLILIQRLVSSPDPIYAARDYITKEHTRLGTRLIIGVLYLDYRPGASFCVCVSENAEHRCV